MSKKSGRKKPLRRKPLTKAQWHEIEERRWAAKSGPVIVTRKEPE